MSNGAVLNVSDTNMIHAGEYRQQHGGPITARSQGTPPPLMAVPPQAATRMYVHYITLHYITFTLQ